MDRFIEDLGRRFSVDDKGDVHPAASGGYSVGAGELRPMTRSLGHISSGH
jgi:hypothetical protein